MFAKILIGLVAMGALGHACGKRVEITQAYCEAEFTAEYATSDNAARDARAWQSYKACLVLAGGK